MRYGKFTPQQATGSTTTHPAVFTQASSPVSNPAAKAGEPGKNILRLQHFTNRKRNFVKNRRGCRVWGKGGRLRGFFARPQAVKVAPDFPCSGSGFDPSGCPDGLEKHNVDSFADAL